MTSDKKVKECILAIHILIGDFSINEKASMLSAILIQLIRDESDIRMGLITISTLANELIDKEEKKKETPQ